MSKFCVGLVASALVLLMSGECYAAHPEGTVTLTSNTDPKKMSDVIVSGDYSITAGAFAKVEIKYYNVEANGDLTFIEMRTATSTPGVGNTGTYQATAFTTDAGQKYRVIATLFGQLALGAEEVIGEKKQFVLWESEAVL